MRTVTGSIIDNAVSSMFANIHENTSKLWRLIVSGLSVKWFGRYAITAVVYKMKEIVGQSSWHTENDEGCQGVFKRSMRLDSLSLKSLKVCIAFYYNGLKVPFATLVLAGVLCFLNV